MRNSQGRTRKVQKKGSSPRCISLVASVRSNVAARLTDLVGLDYVTVSANDFWMPCVKPPPNDQKLDVEKATYAQLNRAVDFFDDPSIPSKLSKWWYATSSTGFSPIWDIASTCTINGKRGLLLVEAKAHSKELDEIGKTAPDKSSGSGSPDSWDNHNRIGAEIAKANAGLKSIAGGSWALCRDHHYQLSCRFAWSWKLASLGVPVVLVYLGFLNAKEMEKRTQKIFQSHDNWEQALRKHANGIVEDSCWENKLLVQGTPFQPLIRVTCEPLPLIYGRAGGRRALP